MLQPGRKYSTASGYRWGFNGKENDKEVKGDGNQYDFGFRIYDPRLGRWFSPDLLTPFMPGVSPYVSFDNDPISIIDPTGLVGEPVTHTVQKNDTYSSISKKYGVSVKNLKQWNHYDEKKLPIGASIRLNAPDLVLPAKDLIKLIDLQANANKVDLAIYDNRSHDIDKIEDHLDKNKEYHNQVTSSIYKKKIKILGNYVNKSIEFNVNDAKQEFNQTWAFRNAMSQVEIGALGATVAPYVFVPLIYEGPAVIISVTRETEIAIYYFGNRLLSATAGDLFLALRYLLRNKLPIDELLQLEKLAEKARDIKTLYKEIKNVKQLYDDIKKILSNF